VSRTKQLFQQAASRAEERIRREQDRKSFVHDVLSAQSRARDRVFATVGRDRVKCDGYYDRWFKASELVEAKTRLSAAMWPEDLERNCPGDMGKAIQFATCLGMVLDGTLAPEDYTDAQWKKLLGIVP
jgi:hypothetical protein